MPYEFKNAVMLPAPERMEMSPPKGFSRSHPDVPPATWSDDGAQSLVLLDILLKHPSFDGDALVDFSVSLLSWWRTGFMTADGVVFDMGVQTQRAFRRLEIGMSPLTSGPADEEDNGNGSLMRSASCALAPLATPADLSEIVGRARLQSMVTHGHVRSQLVCALSALVCYRLLDGFCFDAAIDFACDTLKSMVSEFERQELALVLAGRNERLHGSGYVVDSFWSAAHSVARTSSYEECVKAAISFGNDTDTTACIAGGWAGALYGLESIPSRWKDALVGQDKVERIRHRMLVAQGLIDTDPSAASKPKAPTWASWLLSFARSQVK